MHFSLHERIMKPNRVMYILYSYFCQHHPVATERKICHSVSGNIARYFEVFIMLNIVLLLIAFAGLCSFISEFTETPFLAMYRRFDPLRRRNPLYPKAFGLPIFIAGIAFVLPVTRFFMDFFIALLMVGFGYAYYRYILPRQARNKKTEHG